MEKKNPKARKWLAKSVFWIALIILILLTLLTTALLALRFVDYVTLDDKELQLQHNMDHDMKLFRVEYRNDSGEITVAGADGQAVVAPGTSVEYTIRLRNNDKMALDYEILPKFTQTEGYKIPILVRMLGPDCKYLIGTNTDWVPIDQMPEQVATDTLGVEQSAEYVFQWKWEFESGDDVYDTSLGVAAIDKDITISADFRIVAAMSTQTVTNANFFSTGLGKLTLIGLFLLLLILAILLLLLARERTKAAERREQRELEENELLEEQTEETAQAVES